MNNDTAHRNAAYKWLTSRNIDERMDNAEDIVLAELLQRALAVLSC